LSEVVLTSQNTPTGIGANMAAVFFNAGGRLASVDSGGNVRAYVSEANGTVTLPALTVAGTCSLQGDLQVTFNNTAVVGNVTMNGVLRGRVNVAAGASNLVVISNLVTANTSVFAVAAANDVTGFVKAAEPSAGCFTVHCNAPTANMAVTFILAN
jgi:hypothetical protein